MFLGYKKALSVPDNIPVIVTLEIPHSARSNVYRMGNVRDREFAKHRCESAWVRSIQDPKTGKEFYKAKSMSNPKDVDKLTYHLGRFVKSDKYDPVVNRICSSGVHFYLSYVRALYHKSPFSDSCFQVWHDNGTVRFYAESYRKNPEVSVFHGVFVEYDPDGKVVREFRIKNDIITVAWFYTWKTVLVYDTARNFNGTPVRKHQTLRDPTIENQNIYDVVPQLRAYRR